MDGQAIGVASTLVVDETRYRLEIMDVLIFFVDLRLGSSSDSGTEKAQRQHFVRTTVVLVGRPVAQVMQQPADW